MSKYQRPTQESKERNPRIVELSEAALDTVAGGIAPSAGDRRLDKIYPKKA